MKKMSRKGTNLSSVRVLMACPIAIRDGPWASSNHYSLVIPLKDATNILKISISISFPFTLGQGKFFGVGNINNFEK